MADISDLAGEIRKFKELYRSVYMLQVGETVFIFRTLTKMEYEMYFSLYSRSPNEDPRDAVLGMCLLHPVFDVDTFNNMLAGTVEKLFESIMSCSGFSDPDRIAADIENARNSLSSLESQIAILICKAFPHLQLSSIDNMTYDEIVRYLAISESILDIKLNLEKQPQNKPGTIDFNSENQAMGSPVPGFSNPKTPRGDVSK